MFVFVCCNKSTILILQTVFGDGGGGEIFFVWSFQKPNAFFLKKIYLKKFVCCCTYQQYQKILDQNNKKSF